MKCSNISPSPHASVKLLSAASVSTRRGCVEALIALSPSPNGFTASGVAARVRALSKQSPCQYGPRHAAYDLKKLRGKQIVRRIGHTRHYEPLPTGLRRPRGLSPSRSRKSGVSTCQVEGLHSRSFAPSLPDADLTTRREQLARCV